MAKASNLAVRLATAVVGVPAILALLFVAPPWAFYLLVFPAAMVGANELFGMTHPSDRLSRVIGVLLSAVASLCIFFFGDDLRVVLTLFVGTPIAGMLLTLVRLGDIPTAALRGFAMGVGPLFIAVPLTLLAVLQKSLGAEGPDYVVLALGFAWLSDTGGYFAGRFLGKHKLYEAVSPKKTVEGALGGLVAATLWAVLGHFWFLRSLSLAHGVPLAIVASALGQAGDLAESLVKRSTGVKDSGQIVPGHGGVLDRVDALIVTSTVVYLYVLWFRSVSTS
jgi:phosphatidate cytidylyltransferase